MEFPLDPWLAEELDVEEAGSTLTAPRLRLLSCIECLRPWLNAGERWRLKVTDEFPAETVPYCPDCAAREFGPA